MSSLTPIGIHHMASADFQLQGYTIPKVRRSFCLCLVIELLLFTAKSKTNQSFVPALDADTGVLSLPLHSIPNKNKAVEKCFDFSFSVLIMSTTIFYNWKFNNRWILIVKQFFVWIPASFLNIRLVWCADKNYYGMWVQVTSPISIQILTKH